MPDDEADYLEDDENVLIEEKFFENGKCRLYDLGGEEDSDEYVCQCQIITEHQFTLFTLSCEGKDEAMGFSPLFYLLKQLIMLVRFGSSQMINKVS